jgi:flagellar FliJ protein
MARRFQFRFETMLRIRRQREDEHKRIVADRLRGITQVREQIASLNGQVEQEMEAIRHGQQPGTIDLQQAVRRRHWLGHLHRAALECEARLRGLEAKLAQERAALAEAARQRRILEKLKERQWEQYVAELERLETKESDEMATIRYAYEHEQNADPAKAGA